MSSQPNILLTPPGPAYPSGDPRHSMMDLYLRLNIHGKSAQYGKFATLLKNRQIPHDTSSTANNRYKAPPQPRAALYKDAITPFYDIGRDAIFVPVVNATIANVPQVLVMPH